MADHVPDPTDVYVGQMIRARRKTIGVSQEALAEACGISFQQIQKYERAANRVSASMLVRIADRLNCSSASLLPPTDHADAGDERDLGLAFLAAPFGIEIARAYLRFDSRRQVGTVGVVRALQGTMDALGPAEVAPSQAPLFAPLQEGAAARVN